MPGSDIKLGFGLWNSVPATIALELGVFALGVWLYGRVTRSRDGIGRWGLVGLVTLPLLIYAGVVFGPPPPDLNAVPFSGLAQWLFVWLAWWTDKHRTRRAAASGGMKLDDATSRF